jgi:hypothetical protein
VIDVERLGMAGSGREWRCRGSAGQCTVRLGFGLAVFDMVRLDWIGHGRL